MARGADHRDRGELRRHHGEADRPPWQRAIAEEVPFDRLRPPRPAQAVDADVAEIADDDEPVQPVHRRGVAALSASIAPGGAPAAPVDTLDYRFYWAALDAALDNQALVSFDMGKWSDGTPVKPVLEDFAPIAECSIDVNFCSEPCEINISLGSYTCDATPTTVSLSDPDCDGITGECTSLPDGCTTTYINNICDNCPDVFNPGQEDSDNDGVGDACEPLLISLASFTATAKSGKVLIEWTTESEIDNAGFNLYRAESEDGKYIKINSALISAKGSPTQGTSYEFVDANVQNRKTCYYKLEDIDLNGSSTMHRPVSATPRLIHVLSK